jgi:hypothetical protein
VPAEERVRSGASVTPQADALLHEQNAHEHHRRAHTGSFHEMRSPRIRMPRATPTTGVMYVTVEARVGPQARRVF